MVYMILTPILFSSKTLSIDSNEDRKMDFDDPRDYMDQDIPAGQLPTADPGPIYSFHFLSHSFPGPIHFLSGMPDWMNINQEDLNLALESLSIPLKGPILPGISLQDAIQVNQRHNIHIRQHQNKVLHSNSLIIAIQYSIWTSYTISVFSKP